MTRWEVRRFLNPRNRGLVLAAGRRLSVADSCKNLVLVSPTGSGKTTRYVIPNVLNAEGSLVVTDPSGEIHARTAAHLEQRGFRIQVLQPTKIGASVRFNPLAYWQTPQELRQLATMLGLQSQGRNSDPFWATSAINLLYIALAAVANIPDEREHHLGNLRWLLNHLGEGKSVHAFMSRSLGGSPRLYAEYRAFVAQDPKVAASILSSARAALELWSDADICTLTATNTLELRGLRKEKTALFVIIPEHQVRYFAPVINVFYAACFNHCLVTGGEKNDLPVYFFLDEFGNLGRVHNFSAIITTLRKRRCSISLILQELSQLRAVYGPDEARTIFSGGCANKLFFAGLDLETAEYLERCLGKNTEYDTPFGGMDEHARTVGVPLRSADQIRMMRADEAILLSGRERPVRLRTTRPAHFPSAG